MDETKNIAAANHLDVLNEEAALYESVDKKRRMEAILSSDTEKFRLFTKLMRINRMMKNAKISQQKP